ncbi:uncharacterized protein LAESUDRAFT_727348 [Laetiporus sulphureus 93-53]|uniref:Uncharacterized protein n=1 Tax=Laetiporus sulphureus 93-53 TaxID=1314785 RepID=A0A165DKP2_9APHY|nr:uncharacterized protein LAESUDRAFT_727348 [Laetiporus sulphureus 93-53]KZT05095.1 hypothetical protein LAESUDRAFT_727348 [Laetiporus sulphureus 93-53]
MFVHQGCLPWLLAASCTLCGLLLCWSRRVEQQRKSPKSDIPCMVRARCLNFPCLSGFCWASLDSGRVLRSRQSLSLRERSLADTGHDVCVHIARGLEVYNPLAHPLLLFNTKQIKIIC